MSISLEHVPVGEQVWFRLEDLASWTATGLAEGATVRFTLTQQRNRRSDDSDLHLDDSVLGTVEVAAQKARDVRVSAAEDCRGVVVLRDGTLLLGEVGPDLHIDLAGGRLGAGEYPRMHLLGDIEIDYTATGPVGIEALTVSGVCNIALASNKVTIGEVGSGAGGAPSELLLVPSEASSARSSNRSVSLTVGKAEEVTFVGTAATLQVTKSATHCVFAGDLAVDFSRRSVGDRLVFAKRGGNTPSLSAGQDSTLLQVSGQLQLGQVKGAHIAGASEGFHISRIGEPRGVIGGGGAKSFCEAAFIRGFKIPRGLVGRSHLNFLADAHHLEPHIGNLPGWNYRWRPRSWFNGKPEDFEAAQRDAELMREMRRLAHERGASGGARTKVGWCAQRLRHVTTSGWVERSALSGYRLLGYGERPMPAFVTWLVAAVIVAALTMAGDACGWPGMGGALVEVFHAAFGPVGAITRSGAPAADQEWVYVARAAVAIPLIVGALSLRNYVRASE